MNRIKPFILFWTLISLGLSQSTYFLYFSWNGQEIKLQEIESIPDSVKHRTPRNNSNQLLYIEFSSNGHPVYWTAIHDPRKVHVEYPNTDGSLNRKDIVLDDIDFAIRVPTNFDADRIRFLKPSPGKRSKFESGIPFSTQSAFNTIQELPIRISKSP
tara:strand:- start:1022 stop:1492 length:471 start_codon:yes stop_codon:yes gene_type:complete